MSYYRVALAFALRSNLTKAAEYVNISLMLNENEPGAKRLKKLLARQNYLDPDVRKHLWELIRLRRFKKALKVRLPKTSKAYTIRGFLFAAAGRYSNAINELTKALLLDIGNEQAQQALQFCYKKRSGR